MTSEEALFVERLKQTYSNVELLQLSFDIVSAVALEREAEIHGLKTLCARAADALESNQFDKYSPVGVDLIAELRKAAL